MVPKPITEDYYRVLEVGKCATKETIKKSYHRLALKLHPDRNASNASKLEAFKLLQNAYETLIDPDQRRAYDQIYDSIKRDHPAAEDAQRADAASDSHNEGSVDAAQILAIRKEKADRAIRWQAVRVALESSLFEMRRGIRVLERDIENLSSIAGAEAAEELQKNSWKTWVLSPLYKTAKETDEEKERKSIARQERRVQKDLKERRLCAQQKHLRVKEDQMAEAKQAIDAADRSDNAKIAAIENRIWNRATQDRLEKERLARLAAMQRASVLRQQRDEDERVRSRKAAEEAAVAEALRKHMQQQRRSDTFWQSSSARTSTCDHRGPVQSASVGFVHGAGPTGGGKIEEKLPE